MSESQLPPHLVPFIRSALPSYEAAVLLVFVSRDPGRDWTLDELSTQIGADAISRRELEQFVEHFIRIGLLQRADDEHFRFEPASEDLRGRVNELRDAYDHRPVTLIRVVRDAANAKIQSFSDSFRLKGD